MAIPTLATVGSTEFAVGYQGELASNANRSEIESRINENASAIDFGAPVCAGVAAVPGVIGNCQPAISGGKVLGLAVRALSEANTNTGAGVTAVVNYAQNKMVPILKDGYMWCLAAENVAEQDAVVAIVAGNGLGSATVGAANGTTRLACAGIWQQTVTSGNIGLVHMKAA